MGNQFNWQIEEDPEGSESRTARKSRRIGGIIFWLIALVAVGSLLGSWIVSQDRAREDKRQLIESAQELLNLEQQALTTGDGDLYFSLQENDLDWFTAQLLPENQDIIRAGLQVTNAEQNGGMIWANATWDEQDEALQRVLFFQWRAGQLRQIASDSSYWGTKLQREEDWGRLTYHAVDDPWATSIANYIVNRVIDNCAETCLENRLPITVDVRDDFQETAKPNHVNIPSPRLVGLDADGSPSFRFWQELGRRIQAHMTPATIQFAVPPPRSREGETLLPYNQLAEQFMASNPGIIIEIVNLDSLPEDLSSLAIEFDGVALPPTESMLAAGQVHDLTDYMATDPDFDKADFYEQIWQGSLWRGRTWFMPEAAEMKVLYYDKAAYDAAEHPDPSSRWTWDEMAQEVSTIVSDQPQQGDLTWGFLDVSLDALYSYAYNWNNQCAEEATVFCQTPLQDQNVAAAFDWYYQMAGQPGQMPDLVHQLPELFSPTQMSFLETKLTDDPQSLLINIQGSRRKAAIWVDLPVNYEFNLLLSPIGVVPFPGSDRFDGITPLWLQGSFISQYSERPLAVWQWLKFLSYQSPTPRYIPARPSVAAEMGYWELLPRPLGDVMRTAFPFARPVTIEEQEMLTWEQVTAVVSGEATPFESAQQQPKNSWFNERLEANP